MKKILGIIFYVSALLLSYKGNSATADGVVKVRFNIPESYVDAWRKQTKGSIILYSIKPNTNAFTKAKKPTVEALVADHQIASANVISIPLPEAGKYKVSWNVSAASKWSSEFEYNEATDQEYIIDYDGSAITVTNPREEAALKHREAEERSKGASVEGPVYKTKRPVAGPSVSELSIEGGGGEGAAAPVVEEAETSPAVSKIDEGAAALKIQTAARGMLAKRAVDARRKARVSSESAGAPVGSGTASVASNPMLMVEMDGDEHLRSKVDRRETVASVTYTATSGEQKTVPLNDHTIVVNDLDRRFEVTVKGQDNPHVESIALTERAYGLKAYITPAAVGYFKVDKLELLG